MHYRPNQVGGICARIYLQFFQVFYREDTEKTETVVTHNLGRRKPHVSQIMPQLSQCIHTISSELGRILPAYELGEGISTCHGAP